VNSGRARKFPPPVFRYFAFATTTLSGRPSRPRRERSAFGPSGGGMVKTLSTLV
jgi:hypothetical protein